MPGYPVNATCAAIRGAATDAERLAGLAVVARWFYGPPPSGGCVADAANQQVGGGTPGDGPEVGTPWGYQSCTETLHPFSTRRDAWRYYAYDAAAVRAQCASYFGVAPRLGWLATWAGGYNIADGKRASNIIWSNGRRDPWHGGGFLRASDALPGGAVFVMETTAHHSDLRMPTPADPAELVAVRQREAAIIRRWIDEAAVPRALRAHAA